MKSNTNYKIGICLLMIIFISLYLISGSLAEIAKASNESIQAKELLNQAEKDILEMASKNIPTLRVNETYGEALQLYSAQIAFEEKGGKADYKLITEDVSKIDLIKKDALEANDELEVFKKDYENANKEVNLSEMQGEYDQIILSFNQERFEDTLVLINKGYDRISEIQSSHTVVNAVYLVTSKTLKKFFIENWMRIIVTLAVVFILLLIFWNALKRLRMRIKLNNLIMQKKSINELIKKMQGDYFKTKKISETEYNIKLKFYEEFIRDIDRQIMMLREEMFKREKSNLKKK